VGKVLEKYGAAVPAFYYQISNGSNFHIFFLIYPILGTVKRKRLQKSAPVLEAEPPTEAFMNVRKRQLEEMALNVIIHQGRV